MKKLTPIKARDMAYLVLKKRLNLPPPSQNYFLNRLSFIFCFTLLVISSCRREAELLPKMVKISVDRKKELKGADKIATINSLHKTDKIILAAPPKVNCYYIVPHMEGYLSGLPIEVLYEVNDIIVASFNEVVSSRYESQQDALNAFQTAQYNAFQLATSKGLNYQPPGQQYEPTEQLCDGDVGFERVVDPCIQKLKIRDMMKDTVLINKNKEVIYSTLATGDEYGYEQKVQSFGSTNSYMNIPVRTDGSTNKFTMKFTWNATTGYTIGDTHSHPTGSAPSPADIFGMIKNLTTVESSDTGIDFYKNNVSITVVSGSEKYIATVKDWTVLKTAYAQYTANMDAYNRDYAKLAAEGGGTENALLKKLGNAINLYKENSAGKYEPRERGADDLPAFKICPEY
ncbi:hypothetical protein [Pedobacter borealis]|uniref:hypothetical protein n=1 Tax=Pedobacter borealis TaxID=475254 RepID=UPI0004937C93|nr:hypothetical protein [Pedobacter borealis]